MTTTIRLLLTVLVLPVACTPVPHKDDSAAPVYHSEDPTLTGFVLTCDPALGSWTAEVRTDAWMGRARLWLGTHSDNVERHDISLDRAAADASWDCAASSVPMAVDVRDPGAGTRFRCNERQDLHIQLSITDASNERWTDCRSGGPTDDDPPWAGFSEVPTCDTPLQSRFEDAAYEAVDGDVSDCD